MKKSRLILASQSEARRRLLLRLGFSFEQLPASIDEESLQAQTQKPNQTLDPRRIVRTLAKAKALHVFNLTSQSPDRVVIGSDQILVLNEPRGPLIFGKPHTTMKAERQLKLCSGREVTLWTGVHVEGAATERHAQFRKTWAHVVRMQFRELSGREIRDYVERDNPLDCAGSFKFEERGISLFSKVITTDPTSIEGLPLLSLHEALLATTRQF